MFCLECGTSVAGVERQIEQHNSTSGKVNEMIIKQNLFS